MLQKAYSLVQVKGFDPQKRTFSGIATSPVADRIGDTIDSKGIRYKNPLPLLLYHDSKKPVGQAKFNKYTADGTPFDAVISSLDRPGIVQDRLNEAVDSLSANPPLIRGVSIGFMPLEAPTFNKETGGYHYPSIEVHELSMVVVPAHQDATITTLKALDVDLEQKAAIPPHSTATTSVSWDGPAAKAALKNDAGAAKFRQAFAWVDGSTDPDLKGSYKFIHHEVSSDGSVGAANTVACSAGIAVLNGGRGGSDIPESDRAGVYAHLAAHLKDAGLTPPTLKELPAFGSYDSTGFSYTTVTVNPVVTLKYNSNHAGVSASSRAVKLRPERPMKKSYADMIADCLAARKEKTDRIDTLLTKSGDAGVTLDETEAEDHDTLSAEVVEIDKQLARYRAAEAREKMTLATAGGQSLQARPGAQITVTPKTLPPGIAFARYAMCMGMARGNPYEAKQLAKDNYGDDSVGLVQLIELQTKGAVGAANAQTAGWASELVPYNIMDDFINFLRPQTILGKFGTSQNGVTYPKLRLVPFNTRVSGFNAGTSANWVGEGLPILVSKATSFTTSLTWSKIAALAVLTKEEIRFSNPNAEAKVRDDIAGAMAQKQDKDFLDPSKGPSANVSPASVNYQTVPILTTGTTAAAFRTDFATLLGTFATALLDPSDIVIIMSTIDALNLSLMITSLGNPVFPGLTMAGGNLLGFPVITTTAMTSIGSPVSTIITAVKAGEIYLADDGVVTMDASDQASIEMEGASSSQTGITGTGVSQVSLWQTGMVGLKATREINWKLRRTGAARYIYNSAYRA